jgi:polar amino acid transport system substrate-binding protein
MKSRLAAAAALTVSMLLAACGGAPALPTSSGAPAATTSASSTLGPVQADATLTAKLPDKVRTAKKIIVGVDATYKPNEYLDTDGKTVIGMDVELFNAAAARMGVTTEWQPSAFDQIIIGVQAKKYDVGVSSFTINDERKKVVNMVSYLSAGSLWAVAKGNPKNVDIKNICGLTITYQTGTVQDDEIKATDEKCAPDKKIKKLPFQDQGEVNNAIMTGRADAMTADSPITSYAIKQSDGKLQALGDVYDAAPYGIVTAKEQADFAAAIAQAFSDIKKSGHYDAILAKYGLDKGAVTKFEVNP